MSKLPSRSSVAAHAGSSKKEMVTSLSSEAPRSSSVIAIRLAPSNVHCSPVPQTKSRDIAVMLGDDARNRAVFHSYAARLRLGGPIERARGAA